ncbi:RNA polymerase factor sigma-54 [Halothiobacillus diazotrophicus]|uniref:RNA polymerase sigma-54 factor n=1 Tax=Halothiobacillus diazotrophicus TaxID=1860122 RepID=A0A191ZE63_9GAMM|nr:RNA polymerase factor sigma-54 [Halothiobacillus diazotrophicus]ANJ66157.1 RNA polymerase factor sigma-54 [Halothiobacillus diazotrophicus]
MKAGLELRLGQSLSMTPQLQQSIRLLQLSTLELALEIQQAVETNPLLEIADTDDFSEGEGPSSELAEGSETVDSDYQEDPNALAGEALLSGTDETTPEDPFTVDSQWEDYYESDGSTSFSAPENNHDEFDPYATTSSGVESLRDHLLSQIHLTHLTQRDTAIAAALIESIDNMGYLADSLEEIHAMLIEDWPNLQIEDITTVLHLIQSLDPIGVGARDLNECLCLQLQHKPKDLPYRDVAMRICEQNLIETIAQREYQQAQRALGVDQTALEGALMILQGLDPRPGSSVGSVAADYLIPDVLVSFRNNAWHVDLNPEIAPKLRVNQTYARMINRSSRGEDASYIRSHLQEARWFIKSLRSRNETLLNVARAIVAHQTEFLEQGEVAMKPLVLREIADELSLHESTVSRVTTQKFMLTPRGTFEFKYFFSSHVGTSDGGECSATAIRAMIKKLVNEENPRKPLSDAKIADLLTEQGIDVARRTIAKYREAMGIASSTDRKRLI